MPRFPVAVWRPVTRYQSGPLHVRATQRRLIFHTAISSAKSLHSFFQQPGRATPHFYVNDAGNIEQYIDTDYRSTANLNGNHDCITVESSDEGGRRLSWTDAQITTLARLSVWCHHRHRIPLLRCPSSRPGTRGIGWHRLGIDGNFPQPPGHLLGGRVNGGEKWSLSFGKTCPGNAKIQGTVERIIPRASEILEGDDIMQQEDFERINRIVTRAVNDAVKPLERALANFRQNERARDAEETRRDAAALARVLAVLDRTATPKDVRDAVEDALASHEETNPPPPIGLEVTSARTSHDATPD
jgi:hypothetical protein